MTQRVSTESKGVRAHPFEEVVFEAGTYASLVDLVPENEHPNSLYIRVQQSGHEEGIG